MLHFTWDEHSRVDGLRVVEFLMAASLAIDLAASTSSSRRAVSTWKFRALGEKLGGVSLIESVESIGCRSGSMRPHSPNSMRSDRIEGCIL